MIVWGGNISGTPLNNGGRYNPTANSWTALPTTNAPVARYSHTAVWTGNEMIVWGGQGASMGRYMNDGGRYNLKADSWTAWPIMTAPSTRCSHTAVWTGSEMIVWGGSNGAYPLNDGGRYNPTANSWTALPSTGAPSARRYHTAVWTGTEMIVWGGYNDDNYTYFNDGGRYNPTANTWTALPTINAPVARCNHTAVWTGSEMIVWGGGNEVPPYRNDGGRFNPAANSWTALPTTGAPAARYGHTAVWIGSEMIVWGGDGSSGPLNDGGRYNPVADSWTSLPTTGAPSARTGHTAIWTGSEMIVWGGWPGGSSYLNDGGRYNPAANSWTALAMSRRPHPPYLPHGGVDRHRDDRLGRMARWQQLLERRRALQPRRQ